MAWSVARCAVLARNSLDAYQNNGVPLGTQISLPVASVQTTMRDQKGRRIMGRLERLFSCFELMSQIPTMQLENLIPHASVLVIVHSTEALLCRIVKSMSDLPVSKHHLG
jgi:hypothetical protein